MPLTSLPADFRDRSDDLRNPGVPLDLAGVAAVHVDAELVRARTRALERVSVADPHSAERLRLAVRCLDLTALQPDATPERVRELCARALDPLGYRAGAEAAPNPVRAAAVCIQPRHISVARTALAGSGVAVASVAGDFPTGRAPLAARVAEVRGAVAAGADEIDAVVDLRLIAARDWSSLYDEVRALRDASGPARLKAILRTGEVADAVDVGRASLVALMAGADFLKTSTGEDVVNATLSAGVVMARQIRDYGDRTGHRVGLKPAGGVRTADAALRWVALIADELGSSWSQPSLFRIGASALLEDLRRALAAQPVR